MELSNKKRTVLIKRTFSIGMLSLIVIAGIFFWFDIRLWGFITIAIIATAFTALQFFQINYIDYNSDGEKISLRYHATTSISGGSYEQIEFEKKHLWMAKVERATLIADLTIAIRTPRGIMEYPDVSLVGLTSIEIKLLEDDLKKVIEENKML